MDFGLTLKKVSVEEIDCKFFSEHGKKFFLWYEEQCGFFFIGTISNPFSDRYLTYQGHRYSWRHRHDQDHSHFLTFLLPQSSYVPFSLGDIAFPVVINDSAQVFVGYFGESLHRGTFWHKKHLFVNDSQICYNQIGSREENVHDGFREEVCVADGQAVAKTFVNKNCIYTGSFRMLKHFCCINLLFCFFFFSPMFVFLLIWQFWYILKQFYVLYFWKKIASMPIKSIKQERKKFSLYTSMLIVLHLRIRRFLPFLYPIFYIILCCLQFCATIFYWIFLAVLKLMCRKKKKVFFLFLFPFHHLGPFVKAEYQFFNVSENEVDAVAWHMGLSEVATHYEYSMAKGTKLDQYIVNTGIHGKVHQDIKFFSKNIISTVCSVRGGKKICKEKSQIKASVPLMNGARLLLHDCSKECKQIGKITIENLVLFYEHSNRWNFFYFVHQKIERYSSCFASYGVNNPLYKNPEFCTTSGFFK